MEFTIDERWFDAILNGVKTVEGRANVGRFTELYGGEKVTIKSSKEDVDKITCRITKINWYTSFDRLLKQEGLGCVLPGIETLGDGVRFYDETYSPEEMKTGVLAICMKVI
jgi:ASC-1-like (ASCH) protein